jgi:hypothetical protein
MAGGDDALASSASASLLDAEDDDLDMESEPAAPTRQQSQEAVLSGLLPKLHSLMQLDSDVDMGALLTCLGSANSLYCHMIKEHMSDVGAQVFLMYDSFYQPLMREALLPALQQLLNSERQVQVGAAAGEPASSAVWVLLFMFQRRQLHALTCTWGRTFGARLGSVHAFALASFAASCVHPPGWRQTDAGQPQFACCVTGCHPHRAGALALGALERPMPACLGSYVCAAPAGGRPAAGGLAQRWGIPHGAPAVSFTDVCSLRSSLTFCSQESCWPRRQAAIPAAPGAQQPPHTFRHAACALL